MQAIYITHPEVIIDPKVPMPQWCLSEKGRARAIGLATRALFADETRFLSSNEVKAKELAEILAGGCNGLVTHHWEMNENDRSATGFLSADKFEAQVDKLFGAPDVSANGWETAQNAQLRIVAAITNALAAEKFSAPPVFTGHGCVGTLLKCHIGGRAIARAEDQREIANPGGGNYFAFDLARQELLCEWTPIEQFQGI